MVAGFGFVLISPYFASVLMLWRHWAVVIRPLKRPPLSRENSSNPLSSRVCCCRFCAAFAFGTVNVVDVTYFAVSFTWVWPYWNAFATMPVTAFTRLGSFWIRPL